MSTSTFTATTTVPAGVRIFGREPAVILAFIEAVLMTVVAVFGRQLGLDGGFTVVVLALCSALLGAWSAWATVDTRLGAVLGAFRALLALLLYFGFELNVETQAAISALIAAGLGMWQRTQTTPVADPVSPSPEQVVASPVDVTPGPDAAEGGYADHAQQD